MLDLEYNYNVASSRLCFMKFKNEHVNSAKASIHQLMVILDSSGEFHIYNLEGKEIIAYQMQHVGKIISMDCDGSSGNTFILFFYLLLLFFYLFLFFHLQSVFTYFYMFFVSKLLVGNLLIVTSADDGTLHAVTFQVQSTSLILCHNSIKNFVIRIYLFNLFCSYSNHRRIRSFLRTMALYGRLLIELSVLTNQRFFHWQVRIA